MDQDGAAATVYPGARVERGWRYVSYPRRLPTSNNDLTSAPSAGRPQPVGITAVQQRRTQRNRL